MLTVWIALTLVGMDDDFEFASSAERVHVEDRADAYCAPCDFGPTQSPLAEKRPDLITCIDGSEDEAGEEEEEGEGEAGEEAET
jgi:hypothetical protein